VRRHAGGATDGPEGTISDPDLSDTDLSDTDLSDTDLSDPATPTTW
jgi:hypothetical protein